MEAIIILFIAAAAAFGFAAVRHQSQVAAGNRAAFELRELAIGSRPVGASVCAAGPGYRYCS